jgi:hypothetical protein
MDRLGLGGKSNSVLLNLLLGAALLLTSFAIFFRTSILRRLDRQAQRMSERRVTRWTVVLGVALGVLVSATSVGAGALGTTALLILYPECPTARIAGSDIAHAVPLTLIAGIGHWFMGSVDFMLMGALLIGSIPGVVFGSMLSTHSSDAVLRPILAATLLIVSVRLLTI